MRLALASLIAIAGFAPPAFAQSAPQSAPQTAPSAPAAPPTVVSAPPAPQAPPPPPEPPTDPVAIEVLNALESVCIPVVAGGNLAQLAKTAGFKKNGDSFVYKQ